ncbi:MAG: cytochrome c [Gammaproteobacteria bacterium]
MKVAISILCLLLVSVGISHAAGDIEAGRKKGSECNACHGKDGEGMSPVPPLAGLSVEYFIRQMNAYKAGGREHEMMQMFALQTNDEDTANLAAYYASMSTPCGPEFAVSAQTDAGPKAGDIGKGKGKAAEGGVSSCNGCHGLHGRGDPENPRVAGMAEEYFIHQMNAFKSGEREHLMMQVVVQKLSDQDMVDLAAYYASLH